MKKRTGIIVSIGSPICKSSVQRKAPVYLPHHAQFQHNDNRHSKAAKIARLPPACRMNVPRKPYRYNSNKGEPMLALRKSLGRVVVFIFALFAWSATAFSQETQEGRLMRFPDVYKDKVVFFYGGDLWLASTSGGVARRITSSEGRELFPQFSPDGKSIAFTGQYDGNFNVYVMPADG